ncbi:hypothetical protein M9Y10_002023 [Tritrichomonas musculus]|uniref:Uncharacterized protein n=1 Tax=Tritrichomonas musculus TaxID=1915356 RepID=A0ABR2L9J7_9EUKA
MGICFSCCSKSKPNIEDQYRSLVVTKPQPISLNTIELESSDSSVPLFAPAESDEDQNNNSEPEVLSETEINIFEQDSG